VRPTGYDFPSPPVSDVRTIQQTPAESSRSAPTATFPQSAPHPGFGSVNAFLDISVDAGDGADPAHFRLVCAGVRPASATTLPGAEAACADVVRLGANFFLARPSPGRGCLQLYGGPRTARVEGTIGGREVVSEFSLRNGCEISR
jgi:hypothetical protein